MSSDTRKAAGGGSQTQTLDNTTQKHRNGTMLLDCTVKIQNLKDRTKTSNFDI